MVLSTFMRLVAKRAAAESWAVTLATPLLATLLSCSSDVLPGRSVFYLTIRQPVDPWQLLNRCLKKYLAQPCWHRQAYLLSGAAFPGLNATRAWLANFS